MRNILVLFIMMVIVSCKGNTTDNDKLNVVTTTTIITDLVKTIGGNAINVQGLMGSGVDPHLYKASEGDVSKLANASVIFYNGLHLEGKLVDIFEKMQAQTTVALSEYLDASELIRSNDFASNYDPHVWFNMDYYKQFAIIVAKKLSEADPKNASLFKANLDRYLKELKELKIEVEALVRSLPEDKRILITAHDAFNYFGDAYQFKVMGLQGLSTIAEAGVKDVQKLATFIVEKQIKAIFFETSVSTRTIKALQASAKGKGHQVNVGGALYSDALGSPNTPEGTYLGMYRHNVKTIVNALK